MLGSHRAAVPPGRIAVVALYLVTAFVLHAESSAQTLPQIPNSEIRTLISEFKQDPRGPFQAIRWFCPDGSVIPARDRCSEPGGIQHALHRDVVVRLQSRNGIYLGQILAGAANEAVLDEARFFSRLKQYQLEQFLIRSDDGWILRRARYYRGAYQAEDEEAWGKQFLEWALARPDLATSWFFMMREAVRDIPHEAADNLVQRIRSVSKEISDEYPPFLDLRVKIHGQPSAADTASVSRFRNRHAQEMPGPVLARVDQLLADMRRQYGVDQWPHLRTLAARLAAGSALRKQVEEFSPTGKSPEDRATFLAAVLQSSRAEVERTASGRHRLTMLDLSLAAENLLFTVAGTWRARTVGESLAKIVVLAQAAHGTGLVENWEWSELHAALGDAVTRESMEADELETVLHTARRSAEWGIGMVSATFNEVVELYRGFEPLADAFLDDRMRSVVLLPLGIELSRLSDELALRSGRANDVMRLPSSSGIRGLNPGIAVGELVVVAGSAEDLDFSPDKIYVVNRAPADLKPVAGIATVSEGNVVSHVQLLARNLGIPNAVVSPALLRELEPLAGRRVFYAVSPRGVVRLKAAELMTSEEEALVEQRQRSEEKIAVPTNRLQLQNLSLENLYNLRAEDSGTVCGPKAANLGQLSSLFPGLVAPGFIVPFGVFRRHMDQPMPASGLTYWEFLSLTFRESRSMRAGEEGEDRVDEFILKRLETLRQAIESMPLQAEFVAEIRARFAAVFGAPVGRVPVFVRSDTNMEDLKDFTGAGLNLTVPNVVTESDLLQAIRRVWASPYRERGYRWRQKYLLNPEDVYPSLLVLRSVNVDKSGVMITAGVSSGNPADATVAFNRGVGGAVDGQAAETYLLGQSGISLEAPAREPRYNTLPVTGGVQKRITSFSERILTPVDLQKLRALSDRIRQTLPGTPGVETEGPFDVELGFQDGDMRLFQARPFVENKMAASTLYLTGMDATSDRAVTIDMSDPLPARD